VVLLSELLRNAELGIHLGPIQIPPLYGLSQIILAIVFIVVIIFRRGGLMGDRELDLNAMLQWFRKRPLSNGGS
jgi:branched-chain amino acid transport system permease protein